MPPGWRADVLERGDALTVIVQTDTATATGRMDLGTHEVVVSTTGTDFELRQLTRQRVLRLLADRKRYDDRRSITARIPISYSAADSRTWTPMQRLADFTGALWYPPTPLDDTVAAWSAFRAETAALNKALKRRRFARQQAQHRIEYSSASRTAPDQSQSPAEPHCPEQRPP